MKALFIACSELSAIDGQTNKASLFNLLDHLAVVTAPFIISDASIMLLLEKQDGENNEQEGKIDAYMNGNLLFTIPVKADFGPATRARNLTTLQNLLVPEIGELKLEFSFNEEIQVSWLIKVLHIGPPVKNNERAKEGAEQAPRARPRRRRRAAEA